MKKQNGFSLIFVFIGVTIFAAVVLTFTTKQQQTLSNLAKMIKKETPIMSILKQEEIKTESQETEDDNKSKADEKSITEVIPPQISVQTIENKNDLQSIINDLEATNIENVDEDLSQLEKEIEQI